MDGPVSILKAQRQALKSALKLATKSLHNEARLSVQGLAFRLSGRICCTCIGS